MTIDLLRIVSDALAEADTAISIDDNRVPRNISTDLIEMLCDFPPAYHVLVSVNWKPGFAPGFPWVAVTHTGRFGMTPTVDGYTYLSPPDGLDSADKAAVEAWIVPAVRAAVAEHAPHVAKAKADDAGKRGPVEAWDAVRQVTE